MSQKPSLTIDTTDYQKVGTSMSSPQEILSSGDISLLSPIANETGSGIGNRSLLKKFDKVAKKQ